MAGKNERQRRIARERHRRQQEQRLVRQRQVRRRWLIGLSGVLVLARVDDHAFFTGRGRDYITVGRERAGREPCDEHNRPFSRYGVSGYRGDPHGREPVTKGACPGIWQVRFANDREYCGGSRVVPGHPPAFRDQRYASGSWVCLP